MNAMKKIFGLILVLLLVPVSLDPILALVERMI